MFGFTILFVLTIWITITVLVTVLGYHWGGKLGALLGFMLTMGGWFIYWVLEYAYIQHKVTKLCEMEGGVTVYVTPEEWRRQIGEEEWKRSIYVGSSVQKELRNNAFYVNNKQFNPRFYFTDRILLAYTNNYTHIDGIIQNETAYYDSKFKSVLFVEHKIYPSTGGTANYLRAFKFWLSNIDGCPNKDDLEFSTKYLSSLNQ